VYKNSDRDHGSCFYLLLRLLKIGILWILFQSLIIMLNYILKVLRNILYDKLPKIEKKKKKKKKIKIIKNFY